MKLLRLLSCLAALGNMLTGPFLGSSYGTVRLLMPFAAIDTTNCVANSATVWFAAANGDDSNDGRTPQTPKGVYGAAQAAQPGHRICFMGGTYPETGTFYPLRSGTPSAWIVYQAYGDGPVNVVWTPTAMPCPPAGAADCTMVNAIHQSGNSYLEFRGFTFYGRGLAGHAFSCNNSHHLRFIGNTVYNVQGAGVSTVQCDYVVSDHNIVYHSGYSGTTASWTSGISYNQIKAFDCNDGLHNVISNNIVVGQYDNSPYHSDGSGFILDMDSTPSACSGTTAPYEPAALISNNVAYGNGGRCAEAFEVSSCWLDPDGSDFCANNPQFIKADPRFAAAPYFDSTAAGQYAPAAPPFLLANGLTLQPVSPVYCQGVDPTTLPGVPAQIAADMQNPSNAYYIYKDFNGSARPGAGGCWDLGAYQH